MNFTDIFIRRPVLAIVVSTLIVVLGLRALFDMPVSQFPKTQNAVVTVSTTYYGADAQTVAGFITQPLEGAIAQAQGIDYLSSSSSSGMPRRWRHPINWQPGRRATSSLPGWTRTRASSFTRTIWWPRRPSANGGSRPRRNGCWTISI